MKRSISFMLLAVLLLGLFFLPVKAKAATASSSAGVVSTVGSRLNVRQTASTRAAVVSSLGNGSYVMLISKSGAWWYVEYGKGLYGYCHRDFIKEVSGNTATVKTQTGSLNIRSGPGTSYARIGSLPKGETVIVLSTSGGWSRILYYGTKTGYVSAGYLAGVPVEYSAVSLNVPNFKQTDRRWTNVTIGSSGKTMAQIGCATTAIAMMESYRAGKMIYPDAMAKKLKYTASGSVYWPGDYVTVTNGSGYLNGIYERLKQGTPVLFGAKNFSGKQHWVVITGYTGGSALTAAGFIINDPGSSSRTNLQHFLDEYPVFYKYFHY